jgi:DnaK suppressor protein
MCAVSLGNKHRPVTSWHYSGGMRPEKIASCADHIRSLVKEIEEDLQQQNEGEEVVELDTSIGRLSRMDAMQQQQMALELRRRKENQLMRLENALKRVALGSYGRCGKCKEEISEDRLEIQPDAVLCVRCASQ